MRHPKAFAPPTYFFSVREDVRRWNLTFRGEKTQVEPKIIENYTPVRSPSRNFCPDFSSTTVRFGLKRQIWVLGVKSVPAINNDREHLLVFNGYLRPILHGLRKQGPSSVNTILQGRVAVARSILNQKENSSTSFHAELTKRNVLGIAVYHFDV
jgi:hypothetical protein